MLACSSVQSRGVFASISKLQRSSVASISICLCVGQGYKEALLLVCPYCYYCPSGSTSPRQEKCQKGFYCPGLPELLPVKCDAGSSCTQNGLFAPNEGCFPGYYCPEQSQSPMQVECPAGYFCEENSPEPTPCIEGTFQPYARNG